jgi:hypothetical protein
MNFLVSAVTLLIVTYAAAWALCRVAAKHTPKPTAHTPKPTGIGRRSYAEGRPTMPSVAEPEDEFKRRTR